MIAVFCVLHRDLKSRDAYCDKMMAAINSGVPLPPNEELGLSPLTHFSEWDRREAIKSCFFTPANIVACLEQELYLGRKPSESELKVMNREAIKKMTGWNSPSAKPAQYFAAALAARLSESLEIEPEKSPLDFMRLSFHAVAESKTAFKLYIELLGAEVVNG